MDSNVTLDAMVIFLVELGKSEPEASALCNVAATILLAITKEEPRHRGRPWMSSTTTISRPSSTRPSTASTRSLASLF